MLQKYFPILEEVNSPLASLIALNVTAAAAKIIISGVSNETLEGLLRNAISETSVHRKEIAVAASELEKARVTAAKQVRSLRYRAACAARAARAVSKVGRQVKAVKKPASKASLKSCKGLSLDVCRQRAVAAQSAVRSAVNTYNAASRAADTAINKGGDTRTIRSKVAALKVAVRELEVAHLNFKFAREMLAISLAHHNA